MRLKTARYGFAGTGRARFRSSDGRGLLRARRSSSPKRLGFMHALRQRGPNRAIAAIFCIRIWISSNARRTAMDNSPATSGLAFLSAASSRAYSEPAVRPSLLKEDTSDTSSACSFGQARFRRMNLFALPIITRTRNDEVSTPSRSDRSDVLCTSGDGWPQLPSRRLQMRY